MPESFYLLIDHPALIAVPIALFASLAVISHSRSAWVATAAWLIYLIYEIGMNTRALCSAEACLKRSPLYIGYPVLAFLSIVALVQVYVRFRDKRRRERQQGIRH